MQATLSFSLEPGVQPKQSFRQGGRSSWDSGNKQMSHTWESWNLQSSQGISWVLQTSKWILEEAEQWRWGRVISQTCWAAANHMETSGLPWVIDHAGMSLCCYSHSPVTPVPISDPRLIALWVTRVETPWFTVLFCDFSSWTGEGVHGFSAGDVSRTTDPGML